MTVWTQMIGVGSLRDQGRRAAYDECGDSAEVLEDQGKKFFLRGAVNGFFPNAVSFRFVVHFARTAIDQMKIAVIGTGAMGRCTPDCSPRQATKCGQAIPGASNRGDPQEGLRVEGASGDRTVRVHATCGPRDAGVCDLVIIATKAMHVAQAADRRKPLLGPGTVVLSIQNGLGGPEPGARAWLRARGNRRRRRFRWSMKGPATPITTAGNWFGWANSPGPLRRAWRKLPRCGARAASSEVLDDIDQLVWESSSANVCYSGLVAVTERTIIEVIEDPDAWRVASGCAAEAFSGRRAADPPGLRRPGGLTCAHSA